MSRTLLLSIFHPRSPLHDGAVIIKDRLVEAARCTLPLSNLTTWKGCCSGTRHRAGLGISEQADVIVVIVSEETGIISIAENGTLYREIPVGNLRKELKARLSVEGDRSLASVWRTVTHERVVLMVVRRYDAECEEMLAHHQCAGCHRPACSRRHAFRAPPCLCS